MPSINPRSDSYEALLWDVVTNAHRYIPKPGDQVLDLGAHFGMFSLYCAARGCHVKAYEPNPEAMAELLHTVAVAKEIGLGDIEPWGFAIWRGKENAYICKRMDTSAACVLSPVRWSANDPMVRCISLRDAMQGMKWDCVKVDVEGSEVEIFRTVEQEDFDRIGFLTIEIHNDLLSHQDREYLIAKLKNAFPFYGTIPVKVGGVPTGDLACLYCWRPE